MSLEQQINKDYITAMKAKQKDRSSIISFLRAQIKQVLVDTRVEALDDAEVIGIVKKQVKQREESIRQFREGNREDLAVKEEAELVVLREYLPEEMSADAVAKLVDEALAETGASSMKDMGGVMKIVLDKAAGQADGKLVSSLVKEKLSAL